MEFDHEKNTTRFIYIFKNTQHFFFLEGNTKQLNTIIWYRTKFSYKISCSLKLQFYSMKNEQVKQMWTWASNSIRGAGPRSFYLYISLVTVVMVTKLVQIATVYLLVQFSDPFLRAPSSLYTTFLLHLHRTRASRIWCCWSFHINLLPKLLGSSCESEKPLLRYHFHINAVRVLVVEHLMWRQQLFLELLYCHAPVCLLSVPIFSLGCFGRLSLSVNQFSSTSAFASRGQRCPRHGFLDCNDLPLSSSYTIMDLGLGPQAQYERWMYVTGPYVSTLYILKI